MSHAIQLVEHVPAPLSPEQEAALLECLRRDIDFAKRKPKIGLLNWLIKSRIQWYCIVEPGAQRPEMLRGRKLRDMKDSAVQMAPNNDSLYILDRMLSRIDQCQLNSLDFVHGTARAEAIVFSIKTRIKT